MSINRSFDNHPTVMDTAGVAELLGHPVKTIQIWCRAGMLPAHRELGTRRWWFDPDELIEWIRSETKVMPDGE